MTYHRLAYQLIRLFASTVVFAKLDISAFSAVWFVGHYCIRTSKKRQK